MKKEITKALTGLVTISSLMGGFALSSTSVFAENPDNNSTSLTQDLGTKTSSSESQEPKKEEAKPEEAKPEATTQPEQKEEVQELPKAGSNDKMIGLTALALVGSTAGATYFIKNKNANQQ